MTAPQTTQSTTATDPAALGTTTPSTTPPTGGGDGSTTATEPAGTEATPTAADEWANFDADRAKQTIQNQRRVEAELKRENAEQKAKLDEIEREKLTEAERVAADLAAAQKAAETAREQVIAARFEAAAVSAGIPADRLTAARAVAGEFASSDDAGNVTIDTTVFDRLKADHGYLFGPQAAPQPSVSFGAAASQGPGGQNGAALAPDEIAMAKRANMTVEDWAKYAKRTTR